MNLITIVIMLKRKFSEFYDIKQYRQHASEQFVVKQYTPTNQKIMVDEEK